MRSFKNLLHLGAFDMTALKGHGKALGQAGRNGLAVLLASAALFGFDSQSTALAENKDFVVSWFMQAANASKDDKDCPEGLNPLPEEMVRRQLIALKMPTAQMEELIAGINGGSSSLEVREALVYRGRIDGKPAHAYSYPFSVPDIGLMKPNKGPLAFGFNLDGKIKAGDYTDPDTKERGVDNAFWRATGCMINHRGTRTELPTHGQQHWDLQRDKQPAWIIRVTADDFTKDGDVTVSFNRALERIWRDANGDVRKFSTFRVDPDARWQNTLHGKIKNGVINVAVDQMHLLGDPYVLTDLDMHSAHLRIALTPDGGMEGVLGGYIPWRRVFYEYGSSGYTSEFMIGVNLPAMYWALRKNADADPDAKTGENTSISTAYRVVGLPAFIQTKGEYQKDLTAGPINLDE